MTVFLTAHRFYAYLGNSWSDITGYMIEDMTGQWGIQGNSPRDRLADTEALQITLNNMQGYFTPGGPVAMPGWRKTQWVKLELDFDGVTYVRSGKISDIQAPLSPDGLNKAYVTISDWMEDAAIHPVITPPIQANQRADDAIRTLLGLMPIQPTGGTDLDVGVNVFPTTFDTIAEETKAYSELGKIADSEVGYIYIRRTKNYGEWLTFENSSARNGYRTLDQLPLAASDSGFLLKEDGGYWLKEDGGKFILDQIGDFIIDNDMIDLETDYGKKMVNFFKLTNYPRRMDTTAQTLFHLANPVPIGPYETIHIQGNYSNPNGSGGQVNGKDMIDPVVTTDYRANTLADESGTDFSADISIVSGYGAEGFDHEVINTGASNGYVTRMECRGTGIYMDEAIDTIAQDAASIAQHGYLTETMDQKYQASPAAGIIFITETVEREKQPRTSINGVTILANQSASFMTAFLNFGPGNLIRIKDDRLNIDGWFYIQGVKSFRLTPGGLITFTWILQETRTVTSGDMSRFGLGYTRVNRVDYVDFGDIPSIRNLNQVTIVAEINQASLPGAGEYCWIAGLWSANGGWYFLTDSNGKIVYSQNAIQAGYHPGGQWITNSAVIVPTTRQRIILRRDNTADANLPSIFLGTTNQPVTQVQALIGPIPSQEGSHISLGNIRSPLSFPVLYEFNGIIYGLRIYNRILTFPEFDTAIGFADLTTDGLVFDAMVMPTADLAAALNNALAAPYKACDAFTGAIATTYGAPIVQSF